MTAGDAGRMRETRLPDPRDRWTEDDARGVLDAQRQSGESIAAFGRRHGIAAARLYWWKKRLAGAGAGAALGGTMTLVPATVITDEAAVVIRTPAGITIAATTASPDWIAAVVTALGRSCS